MGTTQLETQAESATDKCQRVAARIRELESGGHSLTVRRDELGKRRGERLALDACGDKAYSQVERQADSEALADLERRIDENNLTLKTLRGGQPTRQRAAELEAVHIAETQMGAVANEARALANEMCCHMDRVYQGLTALRALQAKHHTHAQKRKGILSTHEKADRTDPLVSRLVPTPAPPLRFPLGPQAFINEVANTIAQTSQMRSDRFSRKQFPLLDLGDDIEE